MSVPVLRWPLVACRQTLAGPATPLVSQAPRLPCLQPGGHSPSRPGTRTLPDEARQARPLEPILFPRLQIQFADFPYLHCSTDQSFSPWRPTVVMSMAGLQNLRSLGLSRAVRSAPDNARGAVLCRTPDPIPCLLYTSPSPRDRQKSRMPSSA